ncbi:Lrp/AsnC family transcriptional regulator [Streptomyces tubercidicus]|uniref:Lrp/AsnC family transcriptional regulator n=1 Tax=Streptomyces tubercidicus TaxID=47759 RepID=UPI0034664322
MVKDSDTLHAGDRRIIAALQINPRAAVGVLGRILGEHERTVARKVRRLITSGAIRPTAIYDTLRCGRGSAVQLRLETHSGALDRAAQALTQRSDVRRVVAVSGRSSVLWCEMIVPNIPELHNLVAEGLPGVPDVRNFEVHSTLRTFTTVAEWHLPVLSPEEEDLLRRSAVQHLPTPADRYELSSPERQVADALMENARVSLTDLSHRLGFSVATAGRRVASLLERRMLYLRTEVEPALLGLPVQAQLCLTVPPAALGAVGTALSAYPEVRYCAAITGTQNLIAEVCLRHEADFYRFLDDRLGGIPHVSGVATEIITHAYKRGFVVKPLPATS